MAITVTDPRPIDRAEEILTPKALAILEELHTRFASTRNEVLAARGAKRQRVAETGKLDFLPETQDVRDGDWKVAAAPAALQDRRVEMTGPASPAKMANNALNSGAKVWLADLEDASTPTWANAIDAILNLRDAAQGTLSHTSAEGKEYKLRTDAPLAVVVARPRGWHMPEKHLLIDGEPAVGALVDFGLHFFHVAKQLVHNGQGPYYYLPKELLVKICHKRGAFAMGGMAAVIPNRRHPEDTEAAFAKVRADKTREANDGFDGSWAAHPDLVPTCREVFDAVLVDQPNQLDKQRPEVSVTAEQLLDVASADGQVTESGLRLNLYVAVACTAEWLSGNGAVAIHNLMDDAATAEISRSQVWQQIRNKSVLADTGNTVTLELVERILSEESERLRTEFGDEAFRRYYQPASELIADICLSGDYTDFLTTPAYELVG